MNNVTVFLYLIFLVGIAGATFAYMWKFRVVYTLCSLGCVFDHHDKNLGGEMGR